MKRAFLLGALLFSSSVLANNPITEAVKDQAWPMYKCNIDVNGQDVETVTDETQYTKYQLIGMGQEMFIYPIGDSSDVTLIIDKLGVMKNETGKLGAIAYIYKDKQVIGKYTGSCVQVKK